MANQTPPNPPKSKARKIASKVAQVAGESLMLRSPVIGQAFEMTQMFKRPEANEDGKQVSRLGHIVNLVKQSAIQNSTILRKFTMFVDTFDTFLENDDKKKEEEKKKEVEREGDKANKKDSGAKSATPTLMEYFDNKENPYYLMMQDSKNYLEKIVELLTEQKRILAQSMRIEGEQDERQRSLSALGSVGREPDAWTQVRPPTTMPPAIAEGLGIDTPQQDNENDGWLDTFDDIVDEIKKNSKKIGAWASGIVAGVATLKNRLAGGLSNVWSGLKNLGSRLGRSSTAAGVSAAGIVRPAAPRPLAPTGVPTSPAITTTPPAPGAAPRVGGASTAIPKGAPSAGVATRAPAPAAARPPIRVPGIGGLAGGIPGAILDIMLNPTAMGTDPQEDMRAYIDQRLQESGVSALPEIREVLNSESGKFIREAFPSSEYEILATDSEAARTLALQRFNSPYNTRKPHSEEIFYGDSNVMMNKAIREYTRDAEGFALSPDVIRNKLSQEASSFLSSPAATKAQSTIDSISRPQVPLSFGNAAPSTAPVIVNNQGGPTSINNGGNVTNIVTGGASLALPQLSFNLPSVMN